MSRWSMKADLHIETEDALELYFEVRDTATRDYWTRVNYTTIIPPGTSTLIIPVKRRRSTTTTRRFEPKSAAHYEPKPSRANGSR